MLVVQGRADHLRHSVDSGDEHHIDSITEWCERLNEMSDAIKDINETVTASESEQLEPISLSAAVQGAVDDVVDVMQSNELCDRYGMDTISCGNVVAAYLDSEDEFGNAALIHETVKKIAHREDEGDLLAEGIDRFHEALDVENWTVKGLSFAAHDGRTLNGQGLSYAVATRGADHMFTTMYYYEYPLVVSDEALPKDTLEGKPEMVLRQENARATEDCGIICRFAFSHMTPDRIGTLLDEDYDDLLDVGSQVVELERHFNNQRGIDRADDTLPYDLPDFETALETYYELRGWSEDGTVPDDHVAEDPVVAE